MDFRGRDHNVRRNLFRCSMPWLKITPLLPSVMCSREKKAVQFMTELLGNSIKSLWLALQVRKETGKSKICLRVQGWFWKSSLRLCMLRTTLGTTAETLASPNYYFVLGYSYTLTSQLLIPVQEEWTLLPNPKSTALAVLHVLSL